MRDKLKTKIGNRKYFTGVFQRYGFYKDGNGAICSTIVLFDVRHKGEVVADHVWVDKTPEMDSLGALSVGDKISFRARVVPYKKNSGTCKDVGLELPTKVKRCEE